MKKIFRTFIILGLVASATSCKKYLDVNTNPNDITAATPELILPQALAATASQTWTYSYTYGANLGGYIANAGGVGGFGNFWTFQFNSGDFTGLWSGTFDNLQDYQFILNNTTPTGPYKNYNAVARLMKAYMYFKLVDAYGDVPYTQALKGASNLLPAYDKGADVYKACIAEVNAAIAQFKTTNTGATIGLASSSVGKVDIVVYSGTANSVMSGTGLDMTNWIKFANTIKLRALLKIRNADAATYTAEKASMTALTSTDFISSDVLVNPGYVQQSGKQNPTWNSLNFSYTGSTSTKNYIPTKFATAFYNGNKLIDGTKLANGAPADAGRGNFMMRDYARVNQLGFQNTDPALQPAAPAVGSQWWVQKANAYPATTLTAYPANGLAAEGYGVLKGFDQGQPLILSAESYFLQAEALMNNLITGTGTVATLFDQGVTSSFAYLDKDRTSVISNTNFVPANQLIKYKSDNPSSYLVNFALAANADQQLEAIITQKYIALNMINCDEAWNDFRRTYNATLKTGYPRSVPPSATANAADPVLSISPNFNTIVTPRSDGLTGRILYPSTEFSYNTANVPAVDVNATLVFWDARPKN